MKNRELHDLRADEIERREAWQEKRVEHTWFHVVRGMVMGGEIARIGVVPWAVYCAIKAHTDFETGNAGPSIDRIATLVGCSHDTVQRALRELVKRELVEARKSGRRNIYAINEKVDITVDGQPYVTAQRRYEPAHFAGFIEELRRFAKTGNLPGDKGITFNVNITVNNIHQGDGSSVHIGDVHVSRASLDDAGGLTEEESRAVEDNAQDIRRRLRRVE